MSSGFHGSDFYTPAGIGSRSGISNTVPVQYRSQLGGILGDSSGPIVPQRNDVAVSKRSMTELERQQQQALFLRSVKQRSLQLSPISPLSSVDFSPEISTASSFSSGRYGFTHLQQRQPNPNNASLSEFSFSPFPARAAVLETEPDSEKKMRNQLQELERQLLDDNDDDDGNGSAVSAITNSEWNETIQNLITPSQKPLSPSPTSSSSSSSSSSCSLISPKQLLLDSASAISEGKLDAAAAILARLKPVSNKQGDPEQRLTAYMVAALQSRVNPPESSPIAELCSSEHLMASQILYEASPCFKLGFMATIFTILEETRDQPKIHVVDFDIGKGSQYLLLIKALAERQSSKPTVKITAVNDPSDPVTGNINNNNGLQILRNGLTKMAERNGLALQFNIVCCKISDLKRDTLGCEPDEALAVNFAFRLSKMPDESVSTANPRDELLRSVKRLSPHVVTLVEQEMNANTAPFVARFAEASAYYRAMIESLDATMLRDCTERTHVEECLARKATNAVAREGRDRVERCEVFGKWRARMGMAGFEPRPLGPKVTESTRNQLRLCQNNQGFTLKEEAGGLCVGWMDRTLTVASAWR